MTNLIMNRVVPTGAIVLLVAMLSACGTTRLAENANTSASTSAASKTSATDEIIEQTDSIQADDSENTPAPSLVEKIPEDDPHWQVYSAQMNDAKQTEVASTDQAATVDENTVVEPIETESVAIYADNEAINKYLNAYNAANDDSITSDDIRTYYSHGKYYDNAINMNGSNTTITNIGKGIKIHYSRATQEEFKDDLSKYLRAFDSSLDDEAIQDVWEQLLESSSSVVINEIEITKTASPFERRNPRISSISIEGPIL